MTNFICLACLIFEENENRIQKSPSTMIITFFSLKSTQQKTKELLSQSEEKRCRIVLMIIKSNYNYPMY